MVVFGGSNRKTYSGIFTTTSSSKSKMDTGSDIFNRSIDAFFVFALVAAARVIAFEVYRSFSRGSFSKDKLKPLLKKMCKEGAYWGAIVGLYVVLVYGLGITHIAGDWKNKMFAGVLTGALVSGVFCNNSRDKVIEDSLTGGTIATAAAFLEYVA